MDRKSCPQCDISMLVAFDEDYSYDPIVSVEVVSYVCPNCGHHHSEEFFKKL